MPEKNIVVDPDNVFGLQTDLTTKMRSALKRNDQIFFDAMLALLKSNESQQKDFIKQVLSIDYAIQKMKKFTQLSSTSFIVPGDYDHNKYIQIFEQQLIQNLKEECGNKPGHIALTPKIAYSKSDYILIPGKSYVVKIWLIDKKQKIIPMDFLRFIQKNKILFTGRQGLLLVYQLLPNIFPENEMVVSFDTEKNQFFSSSDFKVSYHMRYVLNGENRYAGGDLSNQNNFNYLLGICKK